MFAFSCHYAWVGREIECLLLPRRAFQERVPGVVRACTGPGLRRARARRRGYNMQGPNRHHHQVRGSFLRSVFIEECSTRVQVSAHAQQSHYVVSTLSCIHAKGRGPVHSAAGYRTRVGALVRTISSTCSNTPTPLHPCVRRYRIKCRYCLVIGVRVTCT
jgi:hypothetical protein